LSIDGSGLSDNTPNTTGVDASGLSDNATGVDAGGLSDGSNTTSVEGTSGGAARVDGSGLHCGGSYNATLKGGVGLGIGHTNTVDGVVFRLNDVLPDNLHGNGDVHRNRAGNVNCKRYLAFNSHDTFKRLGNVDEDLVWDVNRVRHNLFDLIRHGHAVGDRHGNVDWDVDWDIVVNLV